MPTEDWIQDSKEAIFEFFPKYSPHNLQENSLRNNAMCKIFGKFHIEHKSLPGHGQKWKSGK